MFRSFKKGFKTVVGTKVAKEDIKKSPNLHEAYRDLLKQAILNVLTW